MRHALLLASLAVGCGSPARSHYGARPADDPAAHSWAKSIAGDASCAGLAIAVDNEGSTVVAGAFAGRLAIGDSQLISAGTQDAFVASFAIDGSPRWATSFGGPGADRATAIAIGADGAAYVAGEFSGTAQFAGEPRSASGASDTFVAAIARDGAITWLSQIQSTGHVSPSSIAVSPRGDVAVAGTFAGALAADDRAIHSAGSLDAFAAALNRSGNAMWIRRWGGDSADVARAIAFGPGGEIAVAGAVGGEADLLGLPLEAAGDGDTNAFAASLSPDGDPRWARSFGAAGTDVAHAVAFGQDGELYVAGSFTDRIDLGPTAQLEGEEAPDGFVARLSLAGDGLWARRLGGPGADRVQSVAAGDEVVVVAGTFEDRFELAGAKLESRGRHDVFVAKLSDRGAPMWARDVGGRGHDSVGGLAVGGDTRIALVGSFADDLAIDGRPVASGGTPAAFAAQLPP